MLTNETAYDKVVKSPTRMTKLHLQKSLKNFKKVLDKQKKMW